MQVGHIKTTVCTAYHLVATADEDGNCLRVGALLDDQHAVLGGAERQFLDDTGKAQLVRSQFFEARDDASAGSNGNQLNFWTPNPADGRQASLQEHVVRLIVKSPLADGQPGAGIFHLQGK